MTKNSPAPPAGPLASQHSVVAIQSKMPEPSGLCEVSWERICRIIAAHGLLEEPLGRFAPRLADLPCCLWDAPLSNYAGRSLAEIRGLKTHGEKRVAAVLEVFSTLARALDETSPVPELTLRPALPIVRKMERWLVRYQRSAEIPAGDSLTSELIQPWIEQVRIDCGEMTANLVVQRLGLSGDKSTVRQTARAWGRTRARIYQLLDEVAHVARLRWPQGPAALQAVAARWLDTESCQQPAGALLLAAIAVLFPVHRGSVDGVAMKDAHRGPRAGAL